MSFAFQLDNGIPINSFNGALNDKEDQELLYLLSYLEEVHDTDEDIRSLNRYFIKLS